MNLETANRLCEYRKQHHLSQEELAAKMGVSRQAVSKWERAEASPDTDNLILLASIYGVTLDELLHTDCPPREEPAAVADAPVEMAGREPETRSPEGNRLRLWYQLPYAVICVIAYLLFGFWNICGGWAFGWLVFLSIPLYYTLLKAVETQDPSRFAYPVLVTWVFLWLGFQFSLWHPAWILFLTIPVYYPLCAMWKKRE